MKHLLSIEQLAPRDIETILAEAVVMKRTRGQHKTKPLAGQTWAILFSKSSTRTRVSFEVGVHELGGRPMFLSATDIQLGRGEPIKDTARVMGRMIHGAIFRTFAQSDVEEFAHYSGIPTINALTDAEHPCQILADLQTILETRKTLKGLVVTFVGDGACNVPVSWIFAAAKLGFELRIAAPKKFQPSAAILKRAGGNIICTEDLKSRRQRRGRALHRRLGFHGQGSRIRRAPQSLEGLSDQPNPREARQTRRARHALPARLSRQGD
jgi:ornithine carbamoyltransferase